MNLARHPTFLFEANKCFHSVFWNNSLHVNPKYQQNGMLTTVFVPCISNCKDYSQTREDSDIVSWTSKISKFAQDGKVEDARQVFGKMTMQNVISWTAMISSYTQNERMKDARQLFDQMPERNLCSWNAMIAGYARNGNIEEAYRLFDKMPERTVVSWNAMISGYIYSDRIKDARQLFDEMTERNVASWNSLITGYAQCGRIEDARQLFDEMPERDIVSWTVMISGYAQNGLGEEALHLFSQMQKADMEPNQSTFTSVINACTSLVALEWGKHIHGHIIKKGFESNVFVVSAIVSMYAKCGNVNNAFQLFSNKPEGNVVLSISTITGHAKNGRMDCARQLFENMPERNLVSWNAMIAGYVQNGQAEEALELFYQMQYTDMKLNQLTLTSIMSACTNQAFLEQGQQIHTLVIKTGFESDVFVFNALIGMYSKCGNVDDSFRVFKDQ